jgi:hypothetical protein
MSNWGASINGTAGRPAVRGNAMSENSRANRKAVRDLSDCEFLTGLTAEQLREVQMLEKQRVLAKFKKAA